MVILKKMKRLAKCASRSPFWRWNPLKKRAMMEPVNKEVLP